MSRQVSAFDLSGEVRGMPFFRQRSVRIHYEEGGSPSGYPLLLLAPGGLNSALENWSRMAAFNPLEVFKQDFRMIVMDQRNANTGTSTGPVETDDPWNMFLTDQLNLLDYLGVRGFFALGFCIGCSYALGLAQKAPDRLTAAVLCQPIGHRPEDPDVMFESGLSWGKELTARRSDVDMATVEILLHNMYRSPADFVYSVSRDFVRSCQTPLLVLPGNDRPHPHDVGVAVADLAPKSERMDPWKDADLIPQTVEGVRDFFKKHTPAGALR
ncbi:MAG: alpha/beta fold hydrolase [Chloroflexi bacterium]|nr:alpha/beta fold hydrolase [Chloroflexota bacterium]